VHPESVCTSRWIAAFTDAILTTDRRIDASRVMYVIPYFRSGITAYTHLCARVRRRSSSGKGEVEIELKRVGTPLPIYPVYT
jgi:hypothetical protein